ncbi:hypothetical protein L208DRAFT_1379395 [Tricholoma matsutake]|nr:hypothetical protein L208DRAFT_1379395 [Tricholoma matsutake 945]
MAPLSLPRKEWPLHALFFTISNTLKQEQQEVYQLHKETLHDLFDSITTLDNIDGGLTVLLCCPGYSVQGDLAAEKITVDTYVSPRELKEGGKEITLGKQLKVDGQSYLPLPVSKDSPHIQAQCCVAGTFAQDIAIHAMSHSLALPQLSAGPKPVIKTTENDTIPSIKRVETDTEYEATEYDDPPEHLICASAIYVI